MNWYRVRVSDHGVKDVEQVSRREEDGCRVCAACLLGGSQ